MTYRATPEERYHRVSDEIYAEGMALTEADHEGVDGVMVGATIVDHGGPNRVIAWGYLFGDKKRRFSQGHWIHTSSIVEGPDETGVIKTRNSAYRLKMKPQDEDQDVAGTA